eukprot:TRINITY_DN11712_c0_g1_i1.p1 TRINITY_DN11712_c0_g1~~TRINITY_DN11712_c0_g1_i1.p1  ORF type:complete len:376 (-),score=35.97 TRINITY_DN11712_c0_g1_i1:146-1273(-)
MEDRSGIGNPPPQFVSCSVSISLSSVHTAPSHCPARILSPTNHGRRRKARSRYAELQVDGLPPSSKDILLHGGDVEQDSDGRQHEDAVRARRAMHKACPVKHPSLHKASARKKRRQRTHPEGYISDEEEKKVHLRQGATDGARTGSRRGAREETGEHGSERGAYWRGFHDGCASSDLLNRKRLERVEEEIARVRAEHDVMMRMVTQAARCSQPLAQLARGRFSEHPPLSAPSSFNPWPNAGGKRSSSAGACEMRSSSEPLKSSGEVVAHCSPRASSSSTPQPPCPIPRTVPAVVQGQGQEGTAQSSTLDTEREEVREVAARSLSHGAIGNLSGRRESAGARHVAAGHSHEDGGWSSTIHAMSLAENAVRRNGRVT